MNRTGGVLAAMALAGMMVAVVAGCATSTTVRKIQSDPGKFYGKEVGLKGRVTSSYGALGQGVYQLDDGTGKIWVLSEGFGVPGKDAEVKVVGRLVESVAFGGRSFATALRQTKRRD
ncbi:MAG: hypothetical protein L0Z53_07350 [Acidobacteriales bacterium]|nr:hypothetical protein [Terriglobales bacterium]